MNVSFVPFEEACSVIVELSVLVGSARVATRFWQYQTGGRPRRKTREEHANCGTSRLSEPNPWGRFSVRLEAELQASGSKAEQLEIIVQERDRELSSLKATLQEREATISTLEQQDSERKTLIAALEARASEKDAKLQELESALLEKNSKVQELVCAWRIVT